jgi:hypothetical protein
LPAESGFLCKMCVQTTISNACVYVLVRDQCDD